MSQKILYFITEDWYFMSHRFKLAVAARQAGFEVVIVTRISSFQPDIEAAGLKLIPITLERKSTNIFSEVAFLIQLIKIYHKERPSIVHHVALKPIVYGTIAGLITRSPRIVNAFAGLGSVFISKTIKAKLIQTVLLSLYQLLFLTKKVKVIVQNNDDYSLFTKIISKNRLFLIKGAGVDTTHFYPKPPIQTSMPLVMLIARMLKDKGIYEFVEAANLLKNKGINARMILIGDPDPNNPSAIDQQKLESWQIQNKVEWWGRCHHIAQCLDQAHIVVLPSYREGLPKTLLEAASSGKAIVATDVPGCREIVKHQVNGFLVPPKNANELANAIEQLVTNTFLRDQFGKAGRQLVETQFSDEIIIKATLNLYYSY